TQIEGASGGLAMALATPGSGVWGAVKLAPGDYTFLARVWAPAGDQDGFFVDIRSKRDRRVPPSQRHWHSMAYNFTVKADETVSLAVVGQELGLVVDQVAVVKGTYETDEVLLADLPGGDDDGVQVNPEDLPRLVRSARLAEVPDSPVTPTDTTLLRESFDAIPEGISGAHELVDGKFGKATHVGVPDGRFVVDASGMEFGGKGTIEFWVRPRPAQRLWSDQGWHYFIHCEPADGSGDEGVTLDLSRLWSTQLQLTVTAGDKAEALRVSTGSVDADEWHHVLVSWDMVGERQRLWLLLDGVGQRVFFQPLFTPANFASIEIGNTPLSSDLPLLHLDGAIDELHVSKDSVADRLDD
ncbi:MAG TPA: LamG-like jellyroll fold domain-containing protein, partial [Armatimonadota bacterium]|nr:LamG-like jellyroll fold domain-containing protein [Armatimonadota bacterium]